MIINVSPTRHIHTHTHPYTRWYARNQALYGETLQASSNIRLQQLRVRVARSYPNDRMFFPLSLRTLFRMPLRETLTHWATQLQKWLETINVAKKNHTSHTITKQIKSAYLFGKHTLHQSAHNIFTISLRHLLRATLQDQIKWVNNYNAALASSSLTIHQYLRPPGRPPGPPSVRDISLKIPWTTYWLLVYECAP